MLNQLILAMTGLGVVTTPIVLLWLAVAALNVAISRRLQIALWVYAHPRLAAVVGVLEAAGFDPVKTATKLRDALEMLKRKESGEQ